MNQEEDGMGFAGLLPSRAERDAEREFDRAQTNAYAQGRLDQIDEFAELLPGPCYMDLPDGGDVPVLEQFRRMSHDASMWREHAERVRKAIECEVQCEGG